MKRARDAPPTLSSVPPSRAANLNVLYKFTANAPSDCLGSGSEADLDILTLHAPTGEEAVGAGWELTWLKAISPHEAPTAPSLRDTIRRHEPFQESMYKVLGADCGRSEYEAICQDLNAELFINPSSEDNLRALSHFYTRIVKPGLAREASEAGQLQYLASIEWKVIEEMIEKSGPATSTFRKLLSTARLLRNRVFLQIGTWANARMGGSHGRYFSKVDILHTIVSIVRPFVDASTIFIDFSGGYNNFGALLGQRKWVGYDIFPPKDRDGANPAHFRLKNWFDVERLPGSLAEQSEALVGLNPPFGTFGDTASLFIVHTLLMPQPPRLVALITPADTPVLALIVWETNRWLSAIAEDSRVRALPPRSRDSRLLDLYREAKATGGGTVEVAQRSAKRDPALDIVPPPRWVVVTYRDNVCQGLAFEKPGGLMSLANKDPPVFVIISRGDAIVSPRDAVAVPNAARPFSRISWDNFARDEANALIKRKARKARDE